jgi:hypothetical protein
MKRHNQVAFFQGDPPLMTLLAWHYRMTVVENMAALFLQAMGGAKKIPWRQAPSAISVGKDQNSNDPKQVDAQLEHRTAQPAEPEQGTALGVTSALLPSFHVPLFDSSDADDSETEEDWQYEFASQLDHRLQNIVYAL